MVLRLSNMRKWIAYIMVFYCFLYPQLTATVGGKFLYPILFFVIGLSLLIILTGIRRNLSINIMCTEWALLLILSLIRNQGISHGSYLWPVTFSAIALSLIALGSDFGVKFDTWPSKMIKAACILSLIYIIGTFIFFLFPNLYDTMVSFWGYYPNGSEMGSYGYRVGFADNHTANGSYCVFLFLIAGTLLITNTVKKRDKKWCILFLILSFVAVVLTTKRAHLVFSLGVLLVVYYFFSPRRLNNKIFNLLVTVVGVLFVIEFLKDIPAFSGIFEGFTDQGSDISNGRYVYWLYAIELFSDNPLFGIGWLGFRFNSSNLILGTNTGNIGYVDAHNVYVQLLCEVGLIGAIFVIFMFIHFISSTIRTYKRFRRKLNPNEIQILAISVALQLFCLIYGWTGNFLYDRVCFFYFIGCALFLYMRNTIKCKGEVIIK